MTLPPNAENVLDRLEARLDRIEARLDRLVAVLDQAESAVAMATDTLDEVCANAQARGVEIDARATAALEVVEKISDPLVLERLGRLVELATSLEDTVGMAADSFDAWAAEQAARGVDLDERTRTATRLLDRLTEPHTAAALEAMVDAVPKLGPVVRLATTFEDAVAMAADTFDAWAAEQAARGIDIDDRARTAFRLLETLTEPGNAAVAERMVRRLPALEPVAELATTFEPTTAMLFDMFDEHVKSWLDRGIDAEARFVQVVTLVERLTDPEFHRHLEALLDAAPGLMAATRTGELFGMAVDEVTSRPVAPMGVWALIRALSDPEVQHAAGFAIAVARKVGAQLPQSTTPVRT